MRQIKFRGKAKIEPIRGKWVYGNLVKFGEQYTIINIEIVPFFDIKSKEFILINSKTVCQFTGLRDKDGKELYEEDIVSDKIRIYVVRWITEYASYRLVRQIEGKDFDYPICPSGTLEKIGNSIDNPELLNNG